MNAPSMIRTRWAALGAAVAVSVGAGGVGLLHATVPEEAAAFVPITPCRLFDTRPDFQVGPRSAPLGPNDTFVVAATGDRGECTQAGAVPPGARGVVLNVTAVDASQATFVTLFPADAERPNASSLNPAPGQPPTPNAVTTDLDDDGEFALYNRFGQVHVLADVVGYYTDHHHDDRYFTKAEVSALLAERQPVELSGDAAEFDPTTVYESNGLRIVIECGLSAGTVYLVLGSSSGAAVWGHGTWSQSGGNPAAWTLSGEPAVFRLGGSGDPFQASGTLVVDDADPHAYAVVVTFQKAFDCPYRIHLTPIGSGPSPAP